MADSLDFTRTCRLYLSISITWNFAWKYLTVFPIENDLEITSDILIFVFEHLYWPTWIHVTGKRTKRNECGRTGKRSSSNQDIFSSITETCIHNTLCFLPLNCSRSEAAVLISFFSFCFFQENHARMMLHMNVDELQPLIVEIFDLSSPKWGRRRLLNKTKQTW